MKSKIGIVKMKRTFGLLLAAACFAGEFWQTMAQETLEIQYKLSESHSDILQVNANVKTLNFKRVGLISLTLPEGLTELEEIGLHKQELTSLTLPEGLANLRSLNLSENNQLTNLTLPEGLVKLGFLHLGDTPLATLKLPKDLGKNVEGEFTLFVNSDSRDALFFLEQLSVHYEMKEFNLSLSSTIGNLRFPPARELIRNRIPDSDGVFRIRSSSPASDILQGGVEVDIDGVYRITYNNAADYPLLIEVYGVKPQIWLTRQEGGVEILWNIGMLQSAPSIDGPWTDITFDDTRRLFIRSSSPAEFFRVKPQE